MKTKEKETLPPGVKKAVGPEVFVFLLIFLGIFVGLCSVMGTVNMFNT